MIRLISPLLLLSLIIPTFAFSNSDLWQAASEQRWKDVENMLGPNSAVDPDYAPAENPGETALWLAAFWDQKSVVTRMLQLKPTANVDATPANSTGSGGSVLWLAARAGWREIVWFMLRQNPQVNINAAPLDPSLQDLANLLRTCKFDADLSQKERVTHATVLWILAIGRHWDLVGHLLANYPAANFQILNNYRELHLPSHLVKMALIQQMRYRTSQNNRWPVPYGPVARTLEALFMAVTLNGDEPDQWIAELSAADPDLAQIPTEILTAALMMQNTPPAIDISECALYVDDDNAGN